MIIQIDEEKANVVELKVPFKNQDQVDRTLILAVGVKCHHMGGYILDDSLEHVLCKDCNERLNPMYVLKRLAYKETKYHEAAARYQEEMQRLAERSKTKCQHCKQMTRISRS